MQANEIACPQAVLVSFDALPFVSLHNSCQYQLFSLSDVPCACRGSCSFGFELSEAFDGLEDAVTNGDLRVDEIARQTVPKKSTANEVVKQVMVNGAESPGSPTSTDEPEDDQTVDSANTQTENEEYLSSNGRLTESALNTLWETVETRNFAGVKLTRPRYMDALAQSWRACERGALERMMEQYQILYSETFQKHIQVLISHQLHHPTLVLSNGSGLCFSSSQTGLIENDGMTTVLWNDLNRIQREGAEALGYNLELWESGRHPATLISLDGSKRKWAVLESTQIDAVRIHSRPEWHLCCGRPWL